MTIPDYETLMLPLLKITERGPCRIRDAVKLLADQFGLNDEEREKRVESGTRLFDARVHWAATYLAQAGVLRRPKRGHVEITEAGRQLLTEKLNRIDRKVLTRFPAFNQFKQRTKEGHGEAEGVAEVIEAADGLIKPAAQTPFEQIDTAAGEIEAALRKELLQAIGVAHPGFFERLIIRLMLAMGYGASGNGVQTGGPNDQGIDGLITEDALGLDVVYLQAKRYKEDSAISIKDIQAFMGALVGHGAHKGVFVTTSYFTSQAEQFAKKAPQRLILIDGEQLSHLLIKHGVGVRSWRSIDLKKLDTDFFEAEE